MLGSVSLTTIDRNKKGIFKLNYKVYTYLITKITDLTKEKCTKKNNKIHISQSKTHPQDLSKPSISSLILLTQLPSDWNI